MLARIQRLLGRLVAQKLIDAGAGPLLAELAGGVR